MDQFQNFHPKWVKQILKKQLHLLLANRKAEQKQFATANDWSSGQTLLDTQIKMVKYKMESNCVWYIFIPGVPKKPQHV